MVNVGEELLKQHPEWKPKKIKLTAEQRKKLKELEERFAKEAWELYVRTRPKERSNRLIY